MTDELAEKPVAWMYCGEREEPFASIKRWPFDVVESQCWLETPLYTRPALEPSEDVVEALRELIDAIDKARNLVPDDEEGLAASIFCYHLNAAQDRARRVLWSIKETKHD